ncbi:hypothetical protein C8R41DRAFT_781113 [Lentinula lateritia]|uniref:Peroxisomal membrane protein PEX14 n=1 Tax=Lentinula lateritia TaxID=40482 RepID=A0ABQ8V337_9AGAR|nr:hypothetical protein C8R41DRAFT_781113 [Lentinula lateritia]
MAEEDKSTTSPPAPSEPLQESGSQSGAHQPSQSTVEENNRSELILRARIFLRSSQIQSQDVFAKRRFLLDKGLNENEIELLLRELPPQLPRVPPRTYPQPLPSGLLTLLIGLARLLTWVAGGSAALLLLYHKVLLPRIVRTAEARKSLKMHQINLLQKLNASLQSFKETQTQCYAPLPRPVPHKEHSTFASCHGLLDVLKESETQNLQVNQLPQITLLRCAWEDFRALPGCADSNPRTEELFQVLESRIPWLVSDEGLAFERTLWDVLSTTPVFKELISQDSLEGATAPVRWVYVPPEPVVPTAFISSLNSLSKAISTFQYPTTSSPYQYTLQAMTEFTGYISSNLYTPYRPPSIPGTIASSIEPADEMKKEIRALKGLVLNRRSFMPTIPRANIPSRQVP